MKLVSATQLSQLFKNNARCGQTLFPELIKKLVIASVNKIGYIHNILLNSRKTWINGQNNYWNARNYMTKKLARL